jgi:hypothetical protein
MPFRKRTAAELFNEFDTDHGQYLYKDIDPNGYFSRDYL